MRVEIAAALARDIPAIPILLEGTRMPKAMALPPDLRELAQRNALDVRHTSFHADMDRLIAALKAMAKPIAWSAPAAKSASHIIGETKTVPIPSATRVAATPLKQGSSSTNGLWLTAIPTADAVIDARGRWMLELGNDFYSQEPPPIFKHLFIAASPYVDTYLAQGAVVTGIDWADRNHNHEWVAYDRWKIAYGHASNSGASFGDPSNISYLGPDWRPEYAQMSDEVFKKLGGKPLERFIRHP